MKLTFSVILSAFWRSVISMSTWERTAIDATKSRHNSGQSFQTTQICKLQNSNVSNCLSHSEKNFYGDMVGYKRWWWINMYDESVSGPMGDRGCDLSCFPPIPYSMCSYLDIEYLCKFYKCTRWPDGRMFTLSSFLINYRRSPHFWATYFIHNCIGHALMGTKMYWAWYILGDFFTNSSGHLANALNLW
jgi:hypothetical protein